MNSNLIYLFIYQFNKTNYCRMRTSRKRWKEMERWQTSTKEALPFFLQNTVKILKEESERIVCSSVYG